MIDHSTIDRIMSATNIVDVVSEYVTLRRSGASYKGLCPFHDDKTPSFYVNPARGICKCFSCGKGGNAVHFIMELEQLNYVEALKFLARKYGIEVKEREYTDEERRSQSERESMFAVNEWASHFFNDTMLQTEDGQLIGLAYFRSRGFRDDIIEKFRLGFSPDSWDAMTKEAKRKGFKDDFLVRTGLAIRRDNGSLIDKYRNRVIFPWFDVSGKVVAFGGRVLDARTKGVSQKYINSPESEIFHKSNELYGIFQAKKQIAKESLVYMVEGYTDVISMHQCGVENVVANSGTALNEAQIRLLHRFTQNITLLYDGDEAGIKAALRGTDMLLAAGMNVQVLLLPDGDDPDSFARKHNATEFRQYVKDHQTDFIIFKVNLLLNEAGRDPRKRSELANSILQSICVIPDEIVRASYVHECSELMHMDEQMLLRQCNKMRYQYIEQRKLEREREQQRKAYEEARQQQPPLPTDPTQAPLPTVSASRFSREEPPLPTEAPPILPTEEIPLPIEAPPAPEDEASFIPPVTSAPAETYSPAPADSKFIELERMIMSLIVRYGELEINCEDDQGQQQLVAVADFVNSELDIDGLQFRHPLYRQMLADAVACIRQPETTCASHFLSSPELTVSREASDLLTDRYQLSKGQQMPSEKDLRGDYVTHLMLDYKFQVLNDELKTIASQLADPAVVADPKKMTDMLQQHIRLSSVIRVLAKRLGDKVYQK